MWVPSYIRESGLDNLGQLFKPRPIHTTGEKMSYSFTNTVPWRTAIILIVASFVLASCSTIPASPNQIERLFNTSPIGTTFRFGPILAKINRQDRRGTLYRWAFEKSDDAERRRVLQQSIAETVSIANVEFKEISDRARIAKWNLKLSAATKISIFNFAAIENSFIQESFDKLRDGTKLPPPILSIDFTRATIELDAAAFNSWQTYLSNNPSEDGFCAYFVGAPCSILLREATKDHNHQKFKESIEKSQEILRLPQFQESASIIADFLEFRDEWRRRILRAEARIYTAPAEFSPQVDPVGNLYISNKDLADLTPKQFDLILAHEAAHIIALEYDQYVAALVTALINLQNPANTEKMPLKNMLRSLRNMDEMLVDSIAVAHFDFGIDDVKIYADLIQRLESESEPRTNGLLTLAQLRASGADLRAIPLRRMFARFRHCFGLDFRLPNPPISKFGDTKLQEQQYRNSLNEYLTSYTIERSIEMLTQEYPIDATALRSTISKGLDELMCARIPIPINSNTTVVLMVPGLTLDD